MSVSQYQVNWDNYWSELFSDQETAFLDVPAQAEISKVMEVLRGVLNSSMPLIDFGCGNGTQSSVLAKYVSQVIGVDVSSMAIAQAREQYGNQNPRFEMLDAISPAQAVALHEKIGDANVYIRDVLHQIQASDRSVVIESLKTLLGNTGQLFLIELSPTNQDRFAELSRLFEGAPPQLARVFKQGINPADITPENVMTCFSEPQFSILKQGETEIQTNTVLPDGTPLAMAAFYLLIQSNA